MNSQLEIIVCQNQEMLKEVADCANEIWHEYFPFLLSKDQINYMVDKFQSFKAMDEQTRHDHYKYYQVHKDGQMIGYIGLKFEPDRLFLSKLYLKKEARGKHYASDMLEYIFEIAKRQCYQSVYLTCNKHNSNSLAVYEKKGFKKIDEDVTDIGNGYVMDDYIYEYTL